MSILSDFPCSVGGDKITNKKTVEMVARNKILVGDTVYTVDGGDPILCGDEEWWNEFTSTQSSAIFSPDGKVLLIGGRIYSVDGDTITFYDYITINDVSSALFSPDGSLLIVNGVSTYSVDGLNFSLIGEISKDNNGGMYSGVAKSVAFSPDGKLLIISSPSMNLTKLYSVSGTSITYVSDIITSYTVNISGGSYASSSYIEGAAFSPDGTLLAVAGYELKSEDLEYRTAVIYSVSGTELTKIKTINLLKEEDVTGSVTGSSSVAFTPDGNILMVGGTFANKLNAYSVSGTTISFIKTVSVVDSYVDSISFLDSGDKMMLNNSLLYSVSGSIFVYIGRITTDDGNDIVDANCVQYSHDWSILVLSHYFLDIVEDSEKSDVKLYAVNGTTANYIENIYASKKTKALKGKVTNAAFSPAGNVMVLCGEFPGYARVYSVDGAVLTYMGDLKADGSGTALSATPSITFSTTGNFMVMNGGKIYSVNGPEILYAGEIPDTDGITALSGVSGCVFSPTGSIVLVYGSFTGKARLYSYSDTAFTYLCDIPKDSSGAAITGSIITADFSPDGGTLILSVRNGTKAAGTAHSYSISGNSITFVQSVTVASTSSRGYATYIRFSPDGSLVVLCGNVWGKGCVYSVSDSAMTFVSNIYADAGTTALSTISSYAFFSPDGGKMVLIGGFTGRAKLYNVSGGTVSYISDIYMDTETTALDGTPNNVVFIGDGKALILTGPFTGGAKMYSLGESGVNYVCDIFADGDETPLGKISGVSVFNGRNAFMLCGLDGSPGFAEYENAGFAREYILDMSGDIPVVKYDSGGAFLAENGVVIDPPTGCGLGYAIAGAEVGEKGRFCLIGRYMG